MNESKERRKELVDAYMKRVVTGGVYRIVNKENGRFLICSSVDMRAAKNGYDSGLSHGTMSGLIHYWLRDDWAKYGPDAFELEVLETLDKKPDQENRQFAEDIAILKEIWREKLDMTLSYDRKASPVPFSRY